MSEANITLPTLGPAEWTILWVVLAFAVVALLYGVYLVRKVIREDPGSKAMVDVATAIEEGAMAYLGPQVRTMIWFVIVIAGVLFFTYQKTGRPLDISLGVSIAFLMGVAASYGAGFVGMWLAVKGNVRSANAALTSFKKSMELAFNAGAV